MTQMEWAMRYYDAGWNIMPCKDKRPLFDALEIWDRKWELLQTERPQRAIVEWWWKKYPEAQIALITGSISGVSVIDIDMKNVAPSAIYELTVGKELKDVITVTKWCTTLTSHTGGGGLHLFCKYAKVDNSVKSLHPAIDIKSDGGYVILPESVHHETRSAYRWEPMFPFNEENVKGGMAEFPKELLQVADTKGDTVSQLLAGVTQGSRNNSLVKIAGALLWRFTPEDAWPVIVAWNAVNNKPPLGINELKTSYLNIVKRHYATNRRRVSL